AIAALAGVKGAYLNVKINAPGLDDKEFVEKVLDEGEHIREQASFLEKEILEIVNGKIGNA
ncbi:MAG: cyclodeaminase/cyclohydrolase family protein, partial [Bacteroidales bacterium]|nr:cyclodeaminase/cyclohydrolase family protein [Bacteroidales bacterium]